jgi:nanoRNase/pAp phosphatase (c-di-AMP/oligoRNAs hydrolase)
LKSADLEKYKNMALVDSQPDFENNSFPKDRIAKIVIDQHILIKPPQAEALLIDERRGATCEILAEMLMSLKIEPSPNLSTALVYGILNDTMNLLRIEHKKTFEIYQKLLEFCDIKKLTRLQNPKRPTEYFVNLRKAINKAQIYGHVIFCNLEKINDPVYVAHSAEFLLSHKKSIWSLCVGRYKNRLYFSLRTTKHDISAGKILRGIFPKDIQAGGHGNIAGGSFEIEDGMRKNIVDNIIEDIMLKLINKLRTKSKEADFSRLI